MGKIETFEDILAWQKARVLNVQIYKATSNEFFSKDYVLKDQIRRASISILSNIAEGFEREGKQEFIHFLSIAKASCGELRAQLYVALDLNYISKDVFDNLFMDALEISKMISGLMSYLKKYEFKGTKYKVEEPEMEYFKTLK